MHGAKTPLVIPHTLTRPNGLVECASVLDVGAGIRPFGWYTPDEHICIEPFDPYCRILAGAGYQVYQRTACMGLSVLSAEAVLLLDVLEHMDKIVGQRVVELAMRSASRQVVVYTPNGFVKQEGDAWGLGGDEWQRHRSGWLPQDFPGWAIQCVGKGFFALWNVCHE